MSRCIELARLGMGETAPNPLVGAVLVHNGQIVGEGFHRKFGGPHAEVIAVGSVKDSEILPFCTLYVSLEPCSHSGKTPPCTDLIIERKIPEVVIGTTDPYPEVAGAGIERLRKAGVKVTTGVLEEECRELNARFFTFYVKKRPYIVLKWAQTLDGFVGRQCEPDEPSQPLLISGDLSRRLVHKFRSEEAAIMVGTKTVLTDNPSLTTRDWHGKNPVRIIIDRNLKLSDNLNIYKKEARTIVFNQLIGKEEGNTEFVKIDFGTDILPEIIQFLFQHHVQSLMVEGGPTLLSAFIRSGLWDEARIFFSNGYLGSGVKAPEFNFLPEAEELLGNDILKIFRNRN